MLDSPAMARRSSGTRLRAQREAVFVSAYLRDLNGAAAVREAGFECANDTVMAVRLLNKASVKALLAEKQAQQLRPLDLTATRVKRELAQIAFADPAGCFAPDGRPLHVHEMPSHIRAAVRSFRVITRDGVPVVSTVEFWSKTDALKVCAQHLNLLAPKELTITHKFPHAQLSDAELKQRLLESANAIDAEPVEPVEEAKP